jgi:phosphoglucosamine mutase
MGFALGRAGARNGSKPSVLLGRDTRVSGEWIVDILEQGLVSAGVEAISDVEIISTPGLAYLTRHHHYDLGIMVSASHNPYEDNGIKIFGRDGYKLSDDQERRIEESIEGLIEQTDPTAPRNHRSIRLPARHLAADYSTFLKNQVDGDLNGLSIGLDVCNGSAYVTAPEVFLSLGAQTHVINDRPDGKNINLNCGSLHLSGLIETVTKQQLDMGVAFDGDADRAVFVTSSGKVFDGDHVLYALSRSLQQRQLLKSDTVVGTIMSNYALEMTLKDRGIRLVRAAVGDRYVLDMMKSVGSNLGGEPSGHVILSDCHTTGDGILTAVKMAELVSKERESLDDLACGFRPLPQVLDGLRVQRKIPLDSSPKIAQLLRNTEERLRGQGRLVVRYSGTEPLLRIMAEGRDEDEVRDLVSRLKGDLESLFSVSA